MSKPAAKKRSTEEIATEIEYEEFRVGQSGVPKPKVIQVPDQFKRFYANHAEVASAFNEVRLTFVERYTGTSETDVIDEQKCAVVMSPESARNLLRVLREKVE